VNLTYDPVKAQQLIEFGPGNSYTYDENGNVIIKFTMPGAAGTPPPDFGAFL
jgi:hypothetical protein